MPVDPVTVGLVALLILVLLALFWASNRRNFYRSVQESRRGNYNEQSWYPENTDGRDLGSSARITTGASAFPQPSHFTPTQLSKRSESRTVTPLSRGPSYTSGASRITRPTAGTQSKPCGKYKWIWTDQPSTGRPEFPGRPTPPEDELPIEPPVGPPVEPELPLPVTLNVRAVYIAYADLGSTAALQTAVTTALASGYNLLVLAFWLDPTTGADNYSAAKLWQQLSPTEQRALIAAAHAKGARIIVSLGGSTFHNYDHVAAADYGRAGAEFAVANNLDGVDFDMEGLDLAVTTNILTWLTTATAAARAVLGPTRLITHAPQAPYFSPVERPFFGVYLKFATQTPRPSVDYYLIQYYNQGDTYMTYKTQMIDDSSYHPGTAVAELIAAGLDRRTIVVGRLTQPRDSPDHPETWIDPSTLGKWIQMAAKEINWQTGFSTWQWHSTGDPTSAQFLARVIQA